MMSKIKVGAVSYLNTKPLIYGFQQGMLMDSIEMITDYPARIASMLLKNEIDIGLVPVAIIPLLKQAAIVGDYCIGADGPVASVCIFSDVPIAEVKEVLLDYQSRTSVMLARILLKEYWKVNPILTNASEDFRSHISGTTAGLVIGDRAFEQRKRSKFSYDLGSVWKLHTGLPFVFAAWVSNKQLEPQFITAFNEATGWGLQHLDKVIAQNPYPLFDLHAYFTNNVVYQLNNKNRAGLDLFLEKLKETL